MATVALGLASRRYGALLPDVVAAYSGDALWAVLVFWLAAVVRPAAPTWALATAALATAFAVEASQLVHTPGLDALRATRLGALVLGRGFLWSDLVCYTVGVAGAAGADRLLRAHPPRASADLRRETDDAAHGRAPASRS